VALLLKFFIVSNEGTLKTVKHALTKIKYSFPPKTIGFLRKTIVFSQNYIVPTITIVFNSVLWFP
jgi:hypothetical protein